MTGRLMNMAEKCMPFSPDFSLLTAAPAGATALATAVGARCGIRGLRRSLRSCFARGLGARRLSAWGLRAWGLSDRHPHARIQAQLTIRNHPVAGIDHPIRQRGNALILIEHF